MCMTFSTSTRSQTRLSLGLHLSFVGSGPLPNTFTDGLRKIPVHFLGFGAPFGLVAWYGGWGTLATLAAWRSYEEYLDWHQGRDTLAKAIVDLTSQLAGTTLALVLKGTL